MIALSRRSVTGTYKNISLSIWNSVNMKHICSTRLGDSWTGICQQSELLNQISEIPPPLTPPASDSEMNNNVDESDPKGTRTEACTSSKVDIPREMPESGQGLGNRRLICAHADSTGDEAHIPSSSSKWSSRKKMSVADRLPEDAYLFVAPNRYIFKGAEVYESTSGLINGDSDSSDSDNDNSNSSSSSSSTSRRLPNRSQLSTSTSPSNYSVSGSPVSNISPNYADSATPCSASSSNSATSSNTTAPSTTLKSNCHLNATCSTEWSLSSNSSEHGNFSTFIYSPSHPTTMSEVVTSTLNSSADDGEENN